MHDRRRSNCVEASLATQGAQPFLVIGVGGQRYYCNGVATRLCLDRLSESEHIRKYKQPRTGAFACSASRRLVRISVLTQLSGN